MYTLIFLVHCLLSWVNLSLANPSSYASLLSNPGDALYAKAEIAFQEQNFKKAISLYQQSLPYFTKQQTWEKIVYCTIRLADCYDHEGRPVERLKAASLAVGYSRQHLAATRPPFAEALKQKGDAFFGLRNIDSASYYLNEAKDLFLPLRNHHQYVACQIGLAACSYFKGRFKDMETFLLEAHTVAKQKLTPEDDNFPVIFQLYGVLYQQTGDFEKGLHNALRSLDLQLALPRIDSFALANEHTIIGVLYDEKGDWDKAYEYYAQAKEIYLRKDKGHINLVDVYNNIGIYYFEKEDYESAIGYLKRSWLLAQKHDLALVSAKIPPCLNTLAYCYLKTGSLDSARHFVKVLLRYHLENAHTFRRLAAIHLQKKEHKQAINAIQRALALAVPAYGKNHPIIGNIHTEYGQILAASNQPEEALSRYDQALGIFTAGLQEKIFSNRAALERVAPKAAVVNCLQFKAEALLKSAGRENDSARRQALQTYKQAIQFIDYLRLEHQAEGSKLHLAQLAVPVYEGAIEAAYSLYLSTKQERYLVDIFGFSEKNKSIILLDALRESSIKQSALIPARLVTLESSLLLDKSYYRRRIFEAERQQDPDSLKLATWQQKFFLISKRHDSLTMVFKGQYPQYYQLKYNVPDVPLPAIRAQLLPDARSAILAYFVGEQHIYVSGIYADRMLVHRVPKDAAFFDDLKSFREALTFSAVVHQPDSTYKQYTYSALRLYRKLVEPLLKGQPTAVNRLIIIPSDLLGFIPFEALLVDTPRTERTDYRSANLSYLLAQSTLTYGYSVYWLLFDKAVRKEGNGPLKPFAGFAPAFTGPAPAGVRSCDNTALPALACNQEEVSEIRAIFDGEAFLHRHSLKEQFLKNASHYRILHLATHACLDDRDPMMHRIFFSDGSVTASELYHLPLRADLVVLSACNSGMGKLAKGEGFMSLSRAFAHAGVPSMVISLWSVEDCSTSTLMKYFYQHLKSGLSKDEALRQAKLQYLNDSGNLESNPFYWAGFVHMGDPIALEAGKAHAPYHAPLLFGGLVVAFGLAFLLLKTAALPTKR